MKERTQYKPGVSGSQATQWRPGQSGNPAGKSKRRAQFEETFTEALLTEGGAQEAAKLLWEAARAKEPWAIQEICRRFAPETASVRMIHEVEDGKLDYSKLTDEQLQQLEAIFDAVGLQPTSPEDGKARRRLLEFVKQAWHVLEARDGVRRWGPRGRDLRPFAGGD